MKHTIESKRRIGAASKDRRSAALALAARWASPRSCCSVAGCHAEHEAKGLCSMHYQRFRKTGKPGAAAKIHSGDWYVDAYGYKIVSGVREHVYVAEKVLGKPLPAGAIVHHVNGSVSDNANANLVICPSRAYHNLIHARERALDACGNASWLLCPFCGKYDAPENLYIYPNRRAAKHRECFARYREELHASR